MPFFKPAPLLATLLFSSAMLTSAAELITIAEVRAINHGQLPLISNATHDLTLYAHTFRGTRWQSDEIIAAVLEAGRLLAQCDIALAGTELRVIDAPRRFHYFYTPASRELLRTLKAPRPALFFVEDTRNRPAYDAEAIGLKNSKPRPELAHTLWVAHGARDLPYAIAHELVHVLSDSGAHSDEPGNLMREETAPGNDRLTSAQCELIRSRGAANGLLRAK